MSILKLPFTASLESLSEKHYKNIQSRAKASGLPPLEFPALGLTVPRLGTALVIEYILLDKIGDGEDLIGLEASLQIASHMLRARVSQEWTLDRTIELLTLSEVMQIVQAFWEEMNLKKDTPVASPTPTTGVELTGNSEPNIQESENSATNGLPETLSRTSTVQFPSATREESVLYPN